MRAMVCTEYGPPRGLRMGEFDEPAMGDEQVLIDVYSAGVSFVDTLTIRNQHQHKHPLPFVPGMEVAGRVAAVGRRVSGFAPGDRVMALVVDGGYAEQASADSHEVFRIPDSVSFDTAAALASVYLTAYCALRWEAEIGRGERLVVSGAAGGIGLACVSIGAALGADVVACASSTAKCELARLHGAANTVCYGTEDLGASLKALGGDAGFDVAADAVAGDAFNPLFRSLGWGGRYLSLGFAGGAVPAIPANLLLVKNRAALGVVLMYYRRHRPDLLAAAAEELLALVAAERVRPHIDQVLPLERATEGLEAIEGRRVMGKTVLSIQR